MIGHSTLEQMMEWGWGDRGWCIRTYDDVRVGDRAWCKKRSLFFHVDAYYKHRVIGIR